MPKYFMNGTRYEAFERMMMTPPRHIRSDDEPKEDKSSHKKANTKERLTIKSQGKNARKCGKAG